MDQALTSLKLKELRELVRPEHRVAILLQDDPDPDALGSAIALRAILGRNKQTTPIFAFKEVTRPENHNMVRLLEIDVAHANTEELRAFDRIATLDVQPAYFNGRLPRADVVIDHHPGYPSGVAPFEDVRVRYGATSTIMTEYLMTGQERISERLATALVYGIKSDTLALSRRATEEDFEAFAFLARLANYSLLRRIERPELPLSFAPAMARAIKRLRVDRGLLLLYFGAVERDDVIVQMAELCLCFEGVEWVASVGKLGNDLVIAVRNHGTGRSAGEVVRRLFGHIGRAGGHRNMAKAVIPLQAWRRQEGTLSGNAIESRLRDLLLSEIEHGGEAGEGRAAERHAS
jgi:nanoRNase/pAp phosphatase (c-di-AMP/oligoRNAs hydrolase)